MSFLDDLIEFQNKNIENIYRKMTDEEIVFSFIAMEDHHIEQERLNAILID